MRRRMSQIARERKRGSEVKESARGGKLGARVRKGQKAGNDRRERKRDRESERKRRVRSSPPAAAVLVFGECAFLPVSLGPAGDRDCPCTVEGLSEGSLGFVVAGLLS